MKIKERLKRLYYIYLHDYVYSTVDYVKNLGNDFIDIVKELKKPKTWSQLFFLLALISIITKNYTLFKIALPLVIIFGIIRHRVQRDYKKDLIRNALIKNNIIILEDEHERYKRNCFHSKKEPLEFDSWKVVELEKLKNNNK